MPHIEKTFIQRRADSKKALIEEATQRSQKLAEEQKTLSESAYNNTFRLQSKKSSRILREKNAEVLKAVNEAADNFVAAVVRKAVPFDLSNIGSQELVEQVRAVKDQYADILTEGGEICPNGVPAGLDVMCKDSTMLYIGVGAQTKAQNQYADQLARNILTIQGLRYIKEKTPISFVYNTLDTQIAVGDAAEANVNCPLKTTLVQLTGTFSDQVRKRVGAALREDAEKREFSDKALLEGVNGVALEKAKRKLAKQKPTLLEEVFKTTKVLNESTGATDTDYLNESVFVTAILETYNILGCIKMNIDSVSDTLYKKRKAFMK